MFAKLPSLSLSCNTWKINVSVHFVCLQPTTTQLRPSVCRSVPLAPKISKVLISILWLWTFVEILDPTGIVFLTLQISFLVRTDTFSNNPVFLETHLRLSFYCIIHVFKTNLYKYIFENMICLYQFYVSRNIFLNGRQVNILNLKLQKNVLR